MEKNNMEIMPGYAQSYPPPPQRSRKGLWIGLAIGAVVLCLCFIIVAVGVYFYGQNIPLISNFLPSPTPAGLFYNNPSARISLTYPVTWQYSEIGDDSSGFTIIFASSADILEGSANAPQTGAAMAVIPKFSTTDAFSFTIDASSMGDVVNNIAGNSFTNISQGQNLRTFSVSGYPAASGVFTMDTGSGGPSAAYLIAILRNTDIILFFGVCPQTEWSQHQPTFDSIVNTVSLVTP